LLPWPDAKIDNCRSIGTGNPTNAKKEASAGRATEAGKVQPSFMENGFWDFIKKQNIRLPACAAAACLGTGR